MKLTFKFHPIWWTAAARHLSAKDRVFLRRKTYVSVCLPPHINDNKIVVKQKRIG